MQKVVLVLINQHDFAVWRCAVVCSIYAAGVQQSWVNVTSRCFCMLWVEVLRKVSAADNGQPILAVQLQPPQELFSEARSGVFADVCYRGDADLLARKKGFAVKRETI